MTNPNLSTIQLNTLLIPKVLSGKTNAQQDSILNTNGSVRAFLINLFHALQNRTNTKTCCSSLSQYVTTTSTGGRIGLSGKQQVRLYFYLISNQQTGLSRLVQKARSIQERIKVIQSRGIINPT